MMKTIELHKYFLAGSICVSGAAIADHIPELDCLIEPNKLIELSSPVSGVLDTISVDRSDTVKKGQVVATLKSDVEQVKLKASRENLDASLVEKKRALELYRDNVITLSEKEEAEHEAALNKLDVEHAQANLELKKIRSPIDGVVADRYLMPGEFIEEKPILKLAQLDPLRIEVVAPVAYFGRVKTGMHAQIKTEYGAFENLVAEIVVVDKVIDAASGTFGIRLELQNKDNEVPGGLKCLVRFFDPAEETEYVRNQASVVDETGSADVVEEATAVDDTPTAEVPLLLEPDSKDESEATICRRLGPFRKKDKLTALMDALENDISGYAVIDDVKQSESFLVTTGTLASEDAARALEAEMKQAGAKDIAVRSQSSGASVSLGVFSSKKSAYRRLAQIKRMGYDCKVVPQKINKTTYWVEVMANTSEEVLSERVSAAGVVNTNELLYQSCSTEILASGSL